ITLTTMGQKSVFGDTSVLPSMKVATASVVSDIDTTLHVIEVSILFEVLKTSPVLSMSFFSQISIKLAFRLRSLHVPKKAPKKKKTHSATMRSNTDNALLDVEFRSKFDLPPGEVNLKSANCVLKGVLRKHGALY